MPTNAYKKIREVIVYCYDKASGVSGFSFCDKKFNSIWGCGYGKLEKTVRIAENEVIVGVKAMKREGKFFNF